MGVLDEAVEEPSMAPCHLDVDNLDFDRTDFVGFLSFGVFYSEIKNLCIQSAP